jgi:hypothetical protein
VISLVIGMAPFERRLRTILSNTHAPFVCMPRTVYRTNRWSLYKNSWLKIILLINWTEFLLMFRNIEN